MSKSLKLTTENFQEFKELFESAQVIRVGHDNKPVGVNVSLNCKPGTIVLIDEENGIITFSMRELIQFADETNV